MGEKLIDNIELRVTAPKNPLVGLDNALAKLSALNSTLAALQSRLANLKTDAGFKRTSASFTSEIKTSGEQSRKMLAKVFGFDEKDVKAFASGLRETQKAEFKKLFSDAGGDVLRNPTAAGKFYAKYSKAALKNSGDPTLTLQRLLSGGGMPSSAAAPKDPSSGGTGGKGGKPPKGDGRTADFYKDYFHKAKEDIAGQMNKAVSEAKDDAGRDKARRYAAKRYEEVRGLSSIGPNLSSEDSKWVEEEILKLTGQKPINHGHGSMRNQAGTPGAGGKGGGGGGGGGGDEDGDKFSVARQKIRNELTANLRDARAINDPAGMAHVQDKAAAQLKALGGQYELSELKQARLDGEVEKLTTGAAKNRLRSESNQAGVQRASAVQADRDQASSKMTPAQRVGVQRASAVQADKDRKAAEKSASQRVGVQRASAVQAEKDRLATEKSIQRQQAKVAEEQEQWKRNQIRIQRNSIDMENKRRSARPPVLKRTPPPKPGLFAGFEPATFAANIAKVTGWAAAVAVLYKTVALATSSLSSLIGTGAQMARLDQVFSKVGGSTRELTDDILGLAAANGRSKEEALEAAVQWSRLGLSRAQVNEVVRVSLLAANVAEISAGEATEKLQAIMAAYGLRVGEVSGVLGELNAVSNVYNATVGGMLEGLSRTASVAKQAGLPLAELVGILGAAIGTTGQSGANIGNAIKSITVALSNPVLQETMRRQFKLEVTSDGGEDIKQMSQILGDLYDRYQNLNDAQRQSLLFSVAGKTQASRLAAILDSYVKGQSLAITAQLNLNSAEVENAKIKATLKSRIQGLVTEWDRMVAVQGTSGSAFLGGLSPSDAIGETITGLKNLISLLNFRVGGEGSLASALGIGGDSKAEKMARAFALPFHALKQFNEQMDERRGGNEAANRSADRSDQDAQFYGARAGAGEIQQRLIKRLKDAAGGKNFGGMLQQAGTQPFLSNSSPHSQQRALGVVSQLRAMKEMGDIAGMLALLEKEQAMAVARTAANRQQELVVTEQMVKNLTEQNVKLEAAQRLQYDDTRAKQINLNEDRIGKGRVRLADPFDGQGNGEGFDAATQKRMKFMERSKSQLERISQIYRDMPVNGAVQAAERELEMLEQQVRLLDVKAKLVAESGMGLNSQAAAQKEITEQMMKLGQQQAGVQGALPFARTQDKLSFGRQMGEADVARGSFGTNPTERNNNRYDAAFNEFTAIKADPKNLQDAVQVGRMMELQNQMLQLRLEKMGREAELHAEIKQLTIDTNKEFTKSLMMAGPSDLLRKMAAMKMAPGMTGGGFMALSPELRGEVGMLNPKFNPDAMALKREQGQQENRDPVEDRKMMDDIRALTSGLLEKIVPAGAMLNEAAAGMRELANAANVAVANLGNLEVLQQLPAVVGQIIAAAGQGGGGQAGPKIPLGLNAGEAPIDWGNVMRMNP